jgi:WD40 repeat protein
VGAGKLIRQIEERLDDVHALSFSPDGGRLAVADAKGAVSVWNTDTGKPAFPAIASAGAKLVAFSPDGRLLATTGSNRKIALWDGQTGRAGEGIASRMETIAVLTFSPDGRLLAVAGSGAAEFWDVPGAGGRASVDGRN